MQMEHRLPRLWTDVVHRAVSLFDFVLASQFGCDQLAVADDLCIFAGGGVQPNNVFFRDDEEVNRRLGIDILEGKHLVVLVDFFRGDLAGNDLAE